MATRARKGSHMCQRDRRTAQRGSRAALVALSISVFGAALIAGLTTADPTELDRQADDAGALAVVDLSNPGPQSDALERHLIGRPAPGGVSRDAGGERGVLGESVVYSQRTVQDDEGVGPLFLLAASASCPFGSAAADDFTLEESSFVTRVTWEGVYFGAAADFPEPGGAFHVTIYEDNGAGNVGAIVRDIPNAPIARALNPRLPLFLFHPVYTFSAPIEPPLLLEGGKRYWLAINGNPAGAVGPAFAWMVSDEGNALDTPEFDQPLINSAISCKDLPVTQFVPGGSLGFDADLAFTLRTACDPDDCDCDGVPDAEALATGLSADCNANGVPDDCDIAYGVSTDCNGNGVPDECEIIQQVFAHSGKLAPIGTRQPVEFVVPNPPQATGEVYISIAARADLSASDEYLDVSLNGVDLGRIFRTDGSDCPDLDDAAQLILHGPQFNEIVNGGDAVFTVTASSRVNPSLCTSELPYVIIAVDYLRSDDRDCNGNGVLDECDIASGFSSDCNGDGVPDECQVEGLIAFTSGALAPIGDGSPQTFQIAQPPVALDDVEINISVRADLSTTSEYIDVSLNGLFIERIFRTSGEDCTTAPLETTITVDVDLFNQLTASGSAVLEFEPSSAVSAELCNLGSFIDADLVCLARGAGDCNRNSVPDSCEIEMGLVSDRNANGLPDSCELTADFDADGDVDATDLATLLGLWGDPGPLGDFDGSGVVGAGDLAVLLSEFQSDS